MNALRERCLVAVAILGLCLPGLARAQAATVVTGKLALDELTGVVQQAERSGNSVVHEAGREAQRALERLQALLKDNVATPVEQLDATLRAEVSAARALAASLRASLDAMPRCIGGEAEILGASLKGGLQSALDGLPLVDGKPFGYLIQDPAKGVPYILRHEPSQGDRHLVLRGANMWARQDVCEIRAVAQSVSATGELELKVLSSDPEKIDLRVPAAIGPGTWLVNVQAKVKNGLFGCGTPKTEAVSAGFTVVKPLSATVKLRATPACARTETISETFTGGISENGCGTSSKTGSALLTFSRPGYTLERFTFDITERRRGGASAARSGDGVLVNHHAQKRGNTCSHGRGKVSWRATLVGVKKLEDSPGQSLEVFAQRAVLPGESIAYEVPASPAACKATRWTLSAEGTFSDGKTFAIPQLTVPVGASQTSDEAGMRLFFNGSASQGTLAMASASCF